MRGDEVVAANEGLADSRKGFESKTRDVIEDSESIMSKEGTSYPSPTAATGNGAGPYHDRIDNSQEESDLRAQLSHEINQSSGGPVSQAGPFATSQPDQSYPAQMGYGYQHGNATGGPATPVQQFQHQVLIAPIATTPTSSNGNEESARKKPKITRACDECRRKKIRCDAKTETPDVKCNNCSRTNSECLFSKPAQKRGPSRGYIRDLSDRVAELEKLKREHEAAVASGFTPVQTPTQSSPNESLGMPGLKRTHAMSEGNETSNAFAMDDGFASGASVAPYANMGLINVSDGSLAQAEIAILNAYQSSPFKSLLPVVFDDLSEIQTLLSSCSTAVRNGFFLALRAVSFLESADPKYCFDTYRYLTESRMNPITQQPLENLVHLQSIAMLLYAMTFTGHPATQAQPLPAGMLYGTASDIISRLKLFSMTSNRVGNSSEAKLIYKAGRRALWAISIVDAWESLGFGGLRHIQSDSFRIERADRQLLGKYWFLMADAHRIMSRLHYQLLDNNNAEPEANEQKVKTLSGPLEDHARSVVANMDSEVPSDGSVIMGLTLRGLIARFELNHSPSAPTRDMLDLALETVVDLCGPASSLQPLAHHAASLAARTLIDAADFKGYKDDAREGLTRLAEGIARGEVLKYSSWKETLLRACKEKLDNLGGLQHLANAAVGASKGEERSEVGVDLTKAVVDGYLNHGA